MATTNLYTGGNEFKLPNGKFYSGPYHIHPSKGAMVGAFHTSRAHARLTPANEQVDLKLQKIILPKSQFEFLSSNGQASQITPARRPSRPSAPAPRPRRQPRSAPPPASNVQRRTTGYSSY